MRGHSCQPTAHSSQGVGLSQSRGSLGLPPPSPLYPLGSHETCSHRTPWGPAGHIQTWERRGPRLLLP